MSETYIICLSCQCVCVSVCVGVWVCVHVCRVLPTIIGDDRMQPVVGTNQPQLKSSWPLLRSHALFRVSSKRIPTSFPIHTLALILWQPCSKIVVTSCFSVSRYHVLLGKTLRTGSERSSSVWQWTTGALQTVGEVRLWVRVSEVQQMTAKQI